MIEARKFCHNCGADICVDEPITIDDFSMTGDSCPLTYKDTVVRLTRGEQSLVWSLLKAYPSHVTRSTLLNRLDSDGFGDCVQVLICRIRRKLSLVGAPQAIDTVWGRGYRWKPKRGASELEAPLRG